MSETCALCGEAAAPEQSLRHRHCGHLSHTACIDVDTVNYKKCAVCLGDAEPWPAVESSVSSEPVPADGVDYVMTPGRRAPEGSAWTAVTSMLRRQKAPLDVRKTQDPLALLANHVPVQTMMKVNKVGLQHVLRVGGNMHDFLRNGYTWKDLQAYQDISAKGPDRLLQTLQALGTNANHFRDYPGQLPWKEIKAAAELSTSDLCDEFGLHFPADASLQCDGDDQWDAVDLVKLGVCMDDLTGMGLRFVGQYEDLMQGLSRAKATAAEKSLGATEGHLAALIDEQEPLPPVEEEYYEEPAPVAAPIRETPPRVARPVGPMPGMKSARRVVEQRALARCARHGATIKL